MKAVQIDRYAKEIRPVVREIPTPDIGSTEVLVKVKAAAVNPLELLILTGSVKLIQDYPMPLTLGNECAGVVEQVGSRVIGFKKGDKVYTRLPLAKIGAFAEYVAVDQNALAPMPQGYDFTTAAAIPLTGLTAWQGITEELEAKPGSTLLIPGGSGSFGQMAVPIAKALGLRVIVTGNSRARESILAAGAERYLDYQKENYWEVLSGGGLRHRRSGARGVPAGTVGAQAGRAGAEPAHRPQQNLCVEEPFRRRQAAAVHSGGGQIRPGRPQTGQGIPVYLCTCRRGPAAKDYPHRGAKPHCPRHRSSHLYPGYRWPGSGAGAKGSHQRQSADYLLKLWTGSSW